MSDETPSFDVNEKFTQLKDNFIQVYLAFETIYQEFRATGRTDAAPEAAEQLMQAIEVHDKSLSEMEAFFRDPEQLGKSAARSLFDSGATPEEIKEAIDSIHAAAKSLHTQREEMTKFRHVAATLSADEIVRATWDTPLGISPYLIPFIATARLQEAQKLHDQFTSTMEQMDTAENSAPDQQERERINEIRATYISDVQGAIEAARWHAIASAVTTKDPANIYYQRPETN